jgi:CubicO group peptidase (beta-lactamase class C family)
LYLPELRDKGLDGVTLRHLLTMSAGIRYTHEDEQPPLLGLLPFNDDARSTNFPDLRRLALSVRPAPTHLGRPLSTMTLFRCSSV